MPKSKDKKLTAKQQKFVDEYLIDLNATQAAIRADFNLIYDINSFKEKYYVYFLIDPDDCSIFYVGKGSGRRMFSHCRSKKDSNNIKFDKITQIKNKGKTTIEVVFSAHDKEEDSFCVERNLIKELAHTGITNISSGIRTSRESSIIKMQSMIDLFNTYDEWESVVSKEKYDLVVKLFGCPRTFHKRLKDEMVKAKEILENGILISGNLYMGEQEILCLHQNKKNSV